MSGPAKFLSELPRPAQLLLAIVVGAGVVAAVAYFGSWMLGAIVGAGIVAIVVLLLAVQLLSAFVNSRRAEGFSDDLLKDIGRKFDTGLDTFKANDKSIYSLPWYVMVGEPGAGKTEAIRHSNIGFPSGLNKPAQGRGGTVNMDWWFAKKAVLLDTAGRLMFEATEEWRSFLKMLKQHRPQTPINGMILAIPAPSLLTDTSDQIAEKAGQISQQFEAVQRELGVRFPVYVLITKADMIAGFREYFFNLPDPSAQNQMLGWSNPDELDQPFQPELVDQHLKTVSDRLQRRKLALLLEPRTVQENSTRRIEQVDAMYAFPTELTRISSRLRMYLDTIFMPSEWSLKPLFLRGIYFTSAMSEGTALDLDLAEAFGIAPAELPVEMRIFGREKSYFLKDFFLDKCFPEGGLVTAAKNVSREISKRRVIVFGAAALAACALIAATLYGQIALRETVSKPAAFWKTLANAQDKTSFAIVDPTTGDYRGDAKLPPEVGGDPAGLFEMAAKQDAITIPPIFKPWDRVTIGLDSLRRTARRNLFEYGILRPVVSATQSKLTDPKVALDTNAITAAGQILPLAAGDSSSAATTISLDPLLKFLLPGKFDSLPETFKHLPRASTIASYKSEKLQWPPADLLDQNLDTSRVLVAKLANKATQVADDARGLSALVTSLMVANGREVSLLQLPWTAADGDFDGHLSAWTQGLDDLSNARKDFDSALAASGLAAAYQDPDAQAGILGRRFDQISNDRQVVEETFAALASESSQPAILMSRKVSEAAMANAMADLNQSIAAIPATETGGDKPLAWLERSYLLHDALQLRLAAYADETSQLTSKLVNGVPATWRNFADSTGKINLIPPAVDVHSQLDAKANSDLKLATRYAMGHLHTAIEAAVAQDVPGDADAWAKMVTEAAQGSAVQQIAPLPLTPQQSIAVDSRFHPQAAGSVVKAWGQFVADWNSSTDPASPLQARIQAAGKSLQQYVQMYQQYWSHDLQSNPTVLPFADWTAARSLILADDFPQRIGQAFAHLSAARSDAIETLANNCPDLGELKAILSADRTAPAGSGSFITATWKKIASAQNAVEQARILLSADPAKLFPAAANTDDTESRYWKKLSVAFLLSVEQPAKAASDATLDMVKAQLNRFPVSYPGTGQPLTLAEVRQLKDDVSRLMTGHPAEGGQNSGVDPDASASLRRIVLGSHTEVYRSAQLKADTLEMLTKSYSANLYLVPDKQIADLPGGPGRRFATVTFISSIPGEDPIQADWPESDPVLLAHCDFPNDQLQASIQFDGKQNVATLEGGAWWPFVALKNGSPQAVAGESNAWFVHLPVNGSQAGGEWVKLEIKGTRQDVKNPWP
jgi:hypothetical protein